MSSLRPDPVLTERARVDVVEERVASAPLGLRFWDPATDRPVREGLLVRARPAAGGPVTTARPSSRGVHGFVSLPTTRAAEQGPVSDFDDQVDYDVSVVDTWGRFVSMGLEVEAPVAGVLPPDLPGYFVFSAATRPVPPGYVAVRLDLRDETLPVTGTPGAFAPAAHAMVRVETADDVWWGQADADGRVLVLAPAPGFAAPTNGSGPLDPSSQRWPAELEVRYDALPPGAFTGVPDMAAIADQDVATANHVGTTFTGSRAVDVEYGQVLVVRSPGRSDLLVRPA